MDKLDVKIAIGSELGRNFDSRVQNSIIHPRITDVIGLACLGGNSVETAYTTLSPGVPNQEMPDGAVAVEMDKEIHVKIFKDPKEGSSFETVAIEHAKNVIRKHCNTNCEGGANCQLRRKES